MSTQHLNTRIGRKFFRCRLIVACDIDGNGNGNGNGSVQKTIGLGSKITTLHECYALLYVNFVAVPAQLRSQLTKF